MINTILVIDNNALDNAILRNLLYNERYNTISALNWREALDLVKSRNVDLILLDMDMPPADIDSFMEEFSKTVYYTTIPLIMVTSTDKTDIIKKTILNFDIFDYVLKPFENFKKLDSLYNLIFINKIRSALRYRKATRRLAEFENKNEGDK